MNMLKKAKGHPEVEEVVAFLGKGTDFRGVLKFEGTIRVDGHLEGEVVTKDTLIVGDSATIVGNLNVGTLICSGKIQGNISASQKVHFIAPGVLNGDVATARMVVEEGFYLNGRCEMGREGRPVDKAASEKKEEAVEA